MSQVPWLTVQEVADQLRVTTETVRRWIRRGDLSALELGGPRTVYRIRPEDLDHFMWQRYKVNPTSTPEHPPGHERGPDFRAMLEHLPVVTFLSDPNRVQPDSLLYVSAEIEDLLGVPREEWYRDVNGTLNSLIPEEDMAYVEQERDRFRSQEDHFSTEVRFVTRTGKTVWVNIDMEVIRSPDGDPMYWSGVVTDITQQRNVERQLQQRMFRQGRLDAFSKRVLEEESLSVLFTEAVRMVSEVIGTEHARLLEVMPGSDRMTLRAMIAWEPGMIGQRERKLDEVQDVEVSAHGDTQAAYTLSMGSAIRVEDLRNETRFSGPAMAERHGVLSGLTVIIPGRHGRPFGILGAHSDRVRSYSDADISFAQATANSLAMAIGRSSERWMSLPEVANLLQVNVETVRRWIRNHQLAAVMPGGPRTGYRIHSTDLRKFTEHHRTAVRGTD